MKQPWTILWLLYITIVFAYCIKFNVVQLCSKNPWQSKWIENLANLLDKAATNVATHVERINLSGLLTRPSVPFITCTRCVCHDTSVWAGKMRRCRRKRGRHECSPSDTRGGDRRGSWSMDPEERTPRANVNVSPDVRSPIFFFPSHEHRSHAEAMPVTYVRMPVARPALSERPYQMVNSSAKGFYRACVVPFSFVMNDHLSRHLSEYIDPAMMISSRWIGW